MGNYISGMKKKTISGTTSVRRRPMGQGHRDGIGRSASAPVRPRPSWQGDERHGSDSEDDEPSGMWELISSVGFVSNIISTIKKTKTDYDNGRKKMSDKERLKDTGKRMEAYKALCLGGLTSMYWKDITSLVNKVKPTSKPFAAILSGGFAISQAGMLIGLAASSFPKSSPWAESVASNGSLLAVLFNIASLHLEIVEFLPDIILLISWIALSVAFAFYWHIGSQDITIVKPVWKLMKLIWSIFMYFLRFIFWYFIFFPLYLLFGRARFGVLDSFTILAFGSDISGAFQSAAKRELGIGTGRSAAVTDLEKQVEVADAKSSEGLRHRPSAHTPEDDPSAHTPEDGHTPDDVQPADDMV